MIHRTIRSSALMGFADLTRSYGLNPEELAAEQGLASEALHNPDLRLPFTSTAALLAAAAERSGFDDFGLRLSFARRASVWGVVSLVARDQPTLGEVLAAVRRYARLQSEATWFARVDADELVEIHLNYFEPMPPLTFRVSIDLSLATMSRVLREIAGSAWNPECVCFRYGRPKSTALYDQAFGIEVYFDQPFDGFICRRDDLDQAVPNADPAMARQTTRLADGLLGEHRSHLSDDVVEAVIRLLPEGDCSRERVATLLNLGVRTMQRRLAEEGASFAELLDRGREILSQSYVDGSRRPLAEVADLLGFSSQQAFNHWYRARFGESPSNRRRAVQASLK